MYLPDSGGADGAAGTSDGKAKKRQRQESDDEESRCTLSDTDMTTGKPSCYLCTSGGTWPTCRQMHRPVCIIFTSCLLPAIEMLTA